MIPSFKAILIPLTLPLALFTGACAPHAVADHPEQRPQLFVVGQGEAAAVPNLGKVRIGVEERAVSADDAMKRANARMEAVMSAIKAQGVDASDLQTTDLSMYFERHFEAPPQPPRPLAEPKGKTEAQTMEKAAAATESAPPTEPTPEGFYVVRNTVVISVRELNKLGQVIGAAMSAGANQLHGFELTMQDPTALRAEARRLAVEDAMNKAKQLARDAHVELGRIVSVSEVGGPAPMPMMAGKAMEMAQSSMPVEQGELTLNQSVQIVFSLKE